MQIGTIVCVRARQEEQTSARNGGYRRQNNLRAQRHSKHYPAEEMVGKKVVVVTNLPPREMKGIMSEGMIVCAEAPDGTLSLVVPEKDVPSGSVLS